MPSADFCTAVRVPHDTPSSIWNTAQTSRGKNISLHRTPAEFTTPALDGYGLHDHLLTRPAGIASYPVPVRQATILLHASSRPRLTTTPLRFTNPSPPSGWVEDFHLQANIHARHTNKEPAPVGSGSACSTLPPHHLFPQVAPWPGVFLAPPGHSVWVAFHRTRPRGPVSICPVQ